MRANVVSLVALAALAVIAVAGHPSRAAAESETGAALQCDRSCLEGIVNRYLDAMVAHDPARAPLSPAIQFAENDQPLKIGEGLWATASGLGTYKHYFSDPEDGQAGFIGNIKENGIGAILILRLKVENQQITEAEQFVARDPNGAALYEKIGKPDPVWLEAIPAERRQSRDALMAAGYMYFEALQRNDGKGIYPFTDNCDRIEHGRRTTNQPSPQPYGHADMNANDFVMKNCKAQFEVGLMQFVTSVRDRRFLVVDVERGAVMGNSCFDFDGTVETIKMTNGNIWKVSPYFRTPRTHQMNEAFKIENGSIRYIEMTLIEVPFGTRPVWHK